MKCRETQLEKMQLVNSWETHFAKVQPVNNFRETDCRNCRKGDVKVHNYRHGEKYRRLGNASGEHNSCIHTYGKSGFLDFTMSSKHVGHKH